ncbi:hypothetical protein [Brevundimonas pondensis]|uniref:Uncharacterized protein n=1 Tax=Brevundimonas pondensis TaxID=2774189 RepID=A0ABX7SK96_9CAUL|nr:hypothetical protein [Brevundimonas pondensis]QTC88114.1 hypothetical protein IFE19_01515 [Brevundimonas pondensis]
MDLNQPDYEALMRGVDQAVAARPQAPSQPKRDRVSGWRVLDRVLGGETITGGLDAERARLEAEAMKPQRLAMQQEALSAITNPRERALFLGIGGEEWRKNVGEQFAPRSTAAGGRTDILGTGQSVAAPSFSTVNDDIFRNDPLTGQSTVNATAAPAYSDVTARFNAENPVLAANSTWVGPDGQPRATGFIAPEVTNTPQGGTTNVIDPRTGQVINSVQGNPEVRALPDAIRRDNEKNQAAIDDRQAVIDRVDNAIGLLQNDVVNLDPLSRASAWVRNATGQSSPQSRALAEVRRTVESLRNSILNDATGPQTDGDSLRALNQIIDGWGDENVVLDGLQAYRNIQQRKTESQRRIMAQREAQYSGGGQAGGQPVRVQTQAQYQALPSGSTYIAPDGSTRRKP